MKKIILASGSPRRRELLAQIGYTFEVVTSEKEEVYQSTEPQEIVKELALLKAKDVAEKTASDREEDCGRIIIGADTVVAHEGKILGKPKDKEDAARMLEALQGDAHDVYTGVAVICYDKEGQEEVISHAVQTKVYVDVMTEEEIQSYIATGEPMVKRAHTEYKEGLQHILQRLTGITIMWSDFRCLIFIKCFGEKSDY